MTQQAIFPAIVNFTVYTVSLMLRVIATVITLRQECDLSTSQPYKLQ